MAKKKKTAKKAAAKKTAKKVAKKTVKKKSSGKNVAKKTTAKKVAKKPATKKVAKKVTKKTTAKKVVKNVAKKAVAKEKVVTKAKPVGKVSTKTPKKPVAAPPLSTPNEVEAQADVVDLDLDDVQIDVTEEVILTDAEGRRLCRVGECDQVASVDGYCRYHYLLFWKKIQNRKKILVGGKLERYVEELTARYTDKFIEILRKDLRTEKDFLGAVQELELDDSGSGGSFEDEDKTYIEEIRGMASDNNSRTEDEY